MQLLVIKSEYFKTKLANHAVKIGGQQIGDWIAMPTDASVDELDKVTNEMEGVIYDLLIQDKP